MSKRELARYRSTDVGMIHQDPRAHTNPLRTIGDFLVEGVVATGRMNRSEAVDRACGLLGEMGIPDARRRLSQYPHQLSGGLLQRVMIAMALLHEPALVFADEPTTALDVTVQSEVMAILAEQIEERGVGMLFVTHDLDLAAAVTDHLVVMYAGTVVESGPSSTLYETPRHPYTAALLASRPSTTQVRRLLSIPGRPAAAHEVGAGCVFAARCPFADDQCRSERPHPRVLGGSTVACHRAEQVSDELLAAVSR
jgi:oligopeptide/dipeptide ABC transporter ATP-binding protein